MLTEVPFLPAGRAEPELLDRHVKLVMQSPPLSFMLDFPVALLVLNATRQIVYANEKAIVYMGENRSNPIGLRPGEAFLCVRANDGADGCGSGPLCRYCGAARALAEVLSGLAGSEECTIERGRLDHVEQLDLLVWTKPFPVDGELFSLFAVMDISERRRREALERIFLHDLMNTAGSLSSLMNLIDPKESSYDEYFALARGAADQLVEELVSHRLLADAEAGSLPAELALVQIDDIVYAVADLYRRISESRGVSFRVQVEGDRPIWLMTDSVLLKRVLANLCKNAVEASARDEVVRVVCRNHADAVELSVANPSVISEEVRSQLFRRSFSTKGRGRGIGTYAARLFVEEYLGGSISVSSDRDTGTVFTVRIPREPERRPSRGAPPAP